MEDLPAEWLCELMMNTSYTTEPSFDEMDLSLAPPQISLSSLEGTDEYLNLQADIDLNYSSSNDNIPESEFIDQNTEIYHATASRPSLQALNHVLSERKRREKLSQMLIALAALIPGLKKMNKVSIVDGAARYIEQLEDRIKRLEAEVNKSLIKQTLVSASEFKFSGDGNSASWSSNLSEENINQPSPKILVRTSDRNVLVRIDCQEEEGVVTQSMEEIEKLHLKIISSSVMPFGSTADLEINIIAQKGEKFEMKAIDLVETLRAAIPRLQ